MESNKKLSEEFQQNSLVKSSYKMILDSLDDPADINKAMMHGRCQKAYKILTADLEGILIM